MKKNVTMLVLSMLALSLLGQTSSVSQTSSSKTSIAVDKSNERYFYTSYFETQMGCNPLEPKTERANGNKEDAKSLNSGN